MIQCVGRSRGEALHRPVKHPPSVLLAQDQRGTLIADVFPVPMPPRALAATGGDVVNGPSPRGWGEHVDADHGMGCARTIPTRVGRTRWTCTAKSPAADHPHAGGENSSTARLAMSRSGPSPRGWGEHDALALGRGANRTIPTRVGRTCVARFRSSPRSDHPHAGGENLIVAPLVNLERGPSPRGWGELREVANRLAVLRTIPTRVGRTALPLSRAVCAADHPHAGGENHSALMRISAPFGPSPRGWGELADLLAPPPPRRTIPTRVGRTGRNRVSCSTYSDHPHAGGENRHRSTSSSCMSGPSPRGWGEPNRLPALLQFRRTIPTRVGRTSYSCRIRPA